MRMFAPFALVAITLSSATFAQTNPSATTHRTVRVATHTTSVHARTVTHRDGRRHPPVKHVVHRSTVRTPARTATRTTVTTTTKSTHR